MFARQKLNEISHRSKRSEQLYLERSARGEWERYKPFSPPGDFVLNEGLEMIQDFASALKHLNPQPQDLILDLGSGSCWVSEWLRRFNLSSIAVDISLDMLRVGRKRLENSGDPNLTAGDIEHLPFLNETFDKVVCLNSIHHVPDIKKAVSEVYRVLKADGMAIFSEPGKGHSKQPQSVAAMRDFGILEQDVLIPTFVEYCYQAGFAELSIKPFTYVPPDFELQADEWQKWRSYWLQYRPIRVLQRLRLDILEFFGLGKKNQLKFHSIAVELMRILTRTIETHPLVLVRKQPAVDANNDKYNAAIKILTAPKTVHASDTFPIGVEIQNLSSSIWICDPNQSKTFVQLGIQILDSEKRILQKDFFRHQLPRNMQPQGTERVDLIIPSFAERGKFFIKLDLVEEGVTWFELKGAHPVIQEITVT